MSIAQNKKTFVEYEILEKFEAGLVLTGQEIKAIRSGRINLSGTFCRISNPPASKAGNEAFVLNMHIANVDEPERSRKLLLHKAEIQSLIGKTQQKGLSLIPLNLYLKKGKAKLEIALARGKKLYDHRDTLKKRDIDRETERELKN
jgi:SsrA-binding protein